MNTAIILDQPANLSFTNLDQISGKLVFRCQKKIDVEAILVKLEGESRTRLLAPSGPNIERPKPQLEYHKILYRIQMVFPSSDLLNGQMFQMMKGSYTLQPGTHEYPFSFKIPFNNACSTDKNAMPSIKFESGSVDVVNPPTRHVKKTLPPTLSGFPGEAEIRYYVKATIQRHSFFKENPRTYMPFNFFPIEPPRPALTGGEVYARQRHVFEDVRDSDPKSKMKGIFSSKPKEPSSPTANNGAPQVSIDARLPEPAILTCNEDIPLRLVFKKISNFTGLVHLQSLQVSLISTTKIRAHDVYRTETNSWVIMSKSNMGVPLGSASDPINTETLVDDKLWRGQALQNTVAPTFETCNISRIYQLDVRVGLSYAGTHQNAAKPQNIILPLRLDVEIFSGIAPPRELLEAMANARANLRRTSTTTNKQAVDEKLRTERAHSVPIIPKSRAHAEGGSAQPPAQMGSTTQAPPPEYSEAPPSYEDAMGTNLPPVNAHRPDYAPPPPGEDDVLRQDEKTFLRRRDS